MINDEVSVGMTSFYSLRKLNLFLSQSMIFKYLKLVKKPVQKSKQLVLFFIALEVPILAFRKSHVTNVLIQVVHFIINFKGSYSGLEENIPVEHQNVKPLKK